MVGGMFPALGQGVRHSCLKRKKTLFDLPPTFFSTSTRVPMEYFPFFYTQMFLTK